jgi:hypothetical protein
MCIKANGHVRWLLIVDEFDDCIGKSKLSVGVSSCTGNSRTSNKGVISPENERKRIE